MEGDERVINTEGEILPPEDPLTRMIHLMFPPNWLENAYASWVDYISRPVYRPPDVQLRFPRSKKKRIQKKWRDNPKNWGQVIYTLSKNPKAVLRRMELKREREAARRIHRNEERDACQPEVGICRVPPLLEE